MVIGQEVSPVPRCKRARVFLLNEAVQGRDARIRSSTQYSDGDPKVEDSDSRECMEKRQA